MYPFKKLSEICKIKTGKKDVNEGNPNGEFPFFTCAREHTFSDSYSFDMEALLVAGNGDVGHVQYYKGKFEAYQRTYILYDFSSEISVSYLFQYLGGFLKETVSRQKLGNTMPYIKLGMLTDFEIPLPPLSTQLDIVVHLDSAMTEIETLRRETESALASTRELWESYLDNLEGEKVSLGTLVDIRTGKLNANAMKEDGIYPFFTCAKEIYKIDIFAFDCEAILLAGNNAVGDFNVKHYRGKFNAYQRTYIITVNEQSKILYRYLYFQLVKSLDEFKKKSVGAGTKFLKLGMIQDIKIICPPISEQSGIVTHIDAVRAETERLEILYKEKLTSLDELRRSVLTEAFL